MRNQKQKEAYNQILLAYPEYQGSKIEGLDNIIENRRGELWLYQTDDFSIALGVSQEKQTLKVVNASPIGDYDPTEAMKIVFTKIREIMDERQVEDLYAVTMHTNPDPKLREFIRAADKICWELTSIDDHKDPSRMTYRFKRPEGRRGEDSQFKGRKLRW